MPLLAANIRIFSVTCCSSIPLARSLHSHACAGGLSVVLGNQSLLAGADAGNEFLSNDTHLLIRALRDVDEHPERSVRVYAVHHHDDALGLVDHTTRIESMFEVPGKVARIAITRGAGDRISGRTDDDVHQRGVRLETGISGAVNGHRANSDPRLQRGKWRRQETDNTEGARHLGELRPSPCGVHTIGGHTNTRGDGLETGPAACLVLRGIDIVHSRHGACDRYGYSLGIDERHPHHRRAGNKFNDVMAQPREVDAEFALVIALPGRVRFPDTTPVRLVRL